MEATKNQIVRVATALGDLKEQCFLTGGVSIPFYITDTLEEAPRVTLDIDVVIDVKSPIEFRDKIESKLRRQGFVNDSSEDAPICRWKLGNTIVDIMPASSHIFGFSNPWYEKGISTLIPISIDLKMSWKALARHFYWLRNVLPIMKEARLIRVPVLI